ncbi:hypothetical protein BKA69DRAFT_1122567 [Paraphysoderma sedebokerense]|nr:hypothetical protein BKA69DRAFT_1122567 [Paraphysoderma sedebokerense]
MSYPSSYQPQLSHLPSPPHSPEHRAVRCSVSPNTLLQLPNEILLEILSYLPRRFLLNFSLVSSKCFSLSMDPGLWKWLDLSKLSSNSLELVHDKVNHRQQSLSNFGPWTGVSEEFKNQCRIEFQSTSDSSNDGQIVQRDTSSDTSRVPVEISTFEPSEHRMAKVLSVLRRRCQSLQKLKATGAEFCDSELISFFFSEIYVERGCLPFYQPSFKLSKANSYYTLAQLQTISFKFCNVTLRPLMYLFTCYSFPRLTHLSLSGISALTDEFLQNIIPTIQDLRYLDLSHCDSITDGGISPIALYGQKLEHLDLNGVYRITKSGVSELSHHRQIRRLKYFSIDGYGVTDDALASILACNPDLVLFSCSFSESLSDQIFPVLAGLNHLKYLRLRKGTNLSNAGFIQFFIEFSFNGGRLWRLDLSECHSLGDCALQRMIEAGLGVSLVYLNIDWCWDITDAGVNYVLNYCYNLQELYLTGLNELTLADSAAHFQCLKFVSLVSCRLVTMAAVSELSIANPNTVVVTYYNELMKGGAIIGCGWSTLMNGFKDETQQVAPFPDRNSGPGYHLDENVRYRNDEWEEELHPASLSAAEEKHDRMKRAILIVSGHNDADTQFIAVTNPAAQRYQLVEGY